MKFFEDIRVGERDRARQPHLHGRGHQGLRRALRSAAVPSRRGGGGALAFRPALCASGWHTACVWMRLVIDHRRREDDERRARGEPVATLGVSPGFRELHWLKPVYAGDTITYASEVIDKRPSLSRPAMGHHDRAQHRHQSERRAGAVVRQFGLRRAQAAAGTRHDRRRAVETVDVRAAAERERAPRAGVACGAHALHDGYTDLIYRPAAGLAGGVRPRLCGARPAARRVRRHHGELPDSRRACWPSGSAPRPCSRSAPRSPGSAICLAGASAGFAMLLVALVRRRARRQHAAPARLRADGARLRGRALAQGARHLQFRRRHRQDDGAGGRGAAAHARWRGGRRSRCSARCGLRCARRRSSR